MMFEEPRSPKKDPSEYMIQAVSQALDLLELYSGDVDELSLGEITQRLGLSRPSGERLVATLVIRGYLEENRLTQNYRLGLKNLQLRRAMIQQLNQVELARPILQWLVEQCRETVYLVLRKGEYVVYVDAVETDQAVRVASRVGAWRPLYGTASGKMHLALMDRARRDALLPAGDFARHTPNTLTTRAALEEELERIAQLGYAVDNEELESGVRCVAAPVRDFEGRVVSALSISGPAPRLHDERIRAELAPLVMQAAAELSRRLGAANAA